MRLKARVTGPAMSRVGSRIRSNIRSRVKSTLKSRERNWVNK